MFYYLTGLVFLVALFFGYAIGRRIGRRQGLREGLLYAPLELRKLGLEKGRCQICGSRITKNLDSYPLPDYCKKGQPEKFQT